MSLDHLVGQWDITMHHSAVPEPVIGKQSYERVLEDAFVKLRWTYDHPDFPDALALLDAGTCHYFDVRGVVRVFDLTVDDSGWTMHRRGDDFWQRSSATFDSRDRMTGTGENSFDGGATWQHDYSIVYTRTA